MNKITRFILVTTMTVIFISNVCPVRAENGKIWLFGLRYHVYIINGFENHSKSLLIHCRSKQDDLGKHELKHGQEYTWSFKVNIDGSTLFYCNIRQGKALKHFVAFSAVVEGSDCADTGKCYWLVTEAGFYFSSDNFTWWRKFGW